jgi:hypothetical protein
MNSRELREALELPFRRFVYLKQLLGIRTGSRGRLPGVLTSGQAVAIGMLHRALPHHPKDKRDRARWKSKQPSVYMELGIPMILRWRKRMRHRGWFVPSRLDTPPTPAATERAILDRRGTLRAPGGFSRPHLSQPNRYYQPIGPRRPREPDACVLVLCPRPPLPEDNLCFGHRIYLDAQLATLGRHPLYTLQTPNAM